MKTDFLIFTVDDVPATRQILDASLGKDYAVESFASAEDCLARLDSQPAKMPSLFLLDVGLPGIDGYELCRRIKAREDTRRTPVIFISALDDLDSRLKGYDAGGEEFIVKPYKMADLKQKVEVMRNFMAETAQLRQQACESETLTSLIMSNLDEYAILIKFLRELNTCETTHDVAASIFNLLKGFHLDGALQMRMGKETMTLGRDGTSNPLQESVINLMRDGDRIVQFKSRAVFNFEHVTLLTTNFPTEDAELAGRLRDHLAIAVKCAESRLMAMLTASINRSTRSGITELIDTLSDTVRDFDKRFDEAQTKASRITHEMLTELDVIFAQLGLSEQQEDRIKSFIEDRSQKLAHSFEFASGGSRAIHAIRTKLDELIQ